MASTLAPGASPSYTAPPNEARWTWKKGLAASATSRACVTMAAFTASVISSQTWSGLSKLRVSQGCYTSLKSLEIFVAECLTNLAKRKNRVQAIPGPLIIPAREQATFRSDLLWLHSLSQSWHLPAAAVYLYSNTNYKRDNIKRSTQWTHVDRPCLMMSRWISDPRIHQESQQAKKAR